MKAEEEFTVVRLPHGFSGLGTVILQQSFTPWTMHTVIDAIPVMLSG